MVRSKLAAVVAMGALWLAVGCGQEQAAPGRSAGGAAAGSHWRRGGRHGWRLCAG